MKITFVTPHQNHATSGGVYAIHQFAAHLGAFHEVTIAVLRGDARPVPGCQTVGLADAPDADVVVFPADMPVRQHLPGGFQVCLLQGFGTPGNNAVWSNLRRSEAAVCTSEWLLRAAMDSGCPAALVRYGLDRQIYHPPLSGASRDINVLMMSHGLDWKGTEDGLEAIEVAAQAISPLSVQIFGTRDPLSDFEFRASPSREEVGELMRRSEVFVCSSWEEGFGMPGLEAMACGASLVTTDTRGSRDYAIDNVTALVVPPRRPELLARAIASSLMNRTLRNSLAQEGQRLTDTFPDWAGSARLLEDFLVSVTS